MITHGDFVSYSKNLSMLPISALKIERAAPNVPTIRSGAETTGNIVSVKSVSKLNPTTGHVHMQEKSSARIYAVYVASAIPTIRRL